MKRYLSLFLVFACMVSLAACSADAPQETTEGRIQRVLTQLFTCPDEKLAELLPKLTPAAENAGEDGAAFEEYQAHLETVYRAEDFTEAYFPKLGKDLLANMAFPTICAQDGIEVKPEQVEVSLEAEQSHVYAYTARLQVTRNGETVQVTESGTVQTDGDGKISSLSPGLAELMDAIL